MSLSLVFRRDQQLQRCLGLPQSFKQGSEGQTRFESVFQQIDADSSREISWDEFESYFRQPVQDDAPSGKTPEASGGGDPKPDPAAGAAAANGSDAEAKPRAIEGDAEASGDASRRPQQQGEQAGASSSQGSSVPNAFQQMARAAEHEACDTQPGSGSQIGFASDDVVEGLMALSREVDSEQEAGALPDVPSAMSPTTESSSYLYSTATMPQLGGGWVPSYAGAVASRERGSPPQWVPSINLGGMLQAHLPDPEVPPPVSSLLVPHFLPPPLSLSLCGQP